MKVTIAAIGKCKKNSPEKALIDEYIKRSSWNVVIKEADNSNQEEEAKFLQSVIPSGAKVIVLDERGENMKSTELAAKVEKWQINGCSELCFLIGGADGHLQSTRDRADLLLSFGKLTLPHILMRAVLSEQIYRIQTIIAGHPYHRV
ncbi:MAG: 23S rRNA (pseudouridine(1915)-N(3))-methyltransferase RlmH [Alphaproteobacteria bacterium]|nr:23S rRNA (pseudouridine(1915)-N(3))-methyltransferase RlmH [Alphaproteobacteria bacterium]